MRWKDIDEAEAAVAAGAMDQRTLDDAWATGRAVEATLADWPAPIGDWTAFDPPAVGPIRFDPRWEQV